MIADIPDQSVRVGEEIVLDIAQAFKDPDGDQVAGYNFAITNASLAEGSVDTSAGKLTLIGSQEGVTWVTLTACDSGGCSNLGDITFMLTVMPPPNRPPQAVQVHGIPHQTVRVGKSVEVHVKKSDFWDVEGDTIVNYEIAVSDESLASAEIDDSGVITLEGLLEGTATLSVAACDSQACGSGLPLVFDLTVLPPPNRPPEFVGSMSAQDVLLGDSITIELADLFQDPDGDDIQEYRFSSTNIDVATGSINASNATLTLTAKAIGDTTIAVDASDGKLQSNRANATFKMTVTAPEGYKPRVVDKTGDQSVDVGDTLYIDIWRAFKAPERQRITRYHFRIREEGIAREPEMARTGVLTLIGAEEGRSWVAARACNSVGCSEYSDMQFVLTVTEPEDEPNLSPEVDAAAISDRTLILGEAVEMNVSTVFKDPDDDDITDYRIELSRSAVARGSSISNTGRLTLHGTSVGTTKVSVYVCDPDGLCSRPDDFTFRLTVEPAVTEGD